MTIAVRPAVGDSDLDTIAAIVNLTSPEGPTVPMRAVNARLGDPPLPHLPTMRGPLVHGIMEG